MTLHLPILADFLLPHGASNLAPGVDRTWLLVLSVTGFFFCLVVAVMTVFVIRYRRRTPNDVTSNITHNTPLEILWTGIPLALVLVFFYLGFKGFLNYNTPQSDCLVIDVAAKQWSFTFTYPNGAQDGNLYLLLNEPVRLNLHSDDVLHAIYLPNFRTQRNLVPGRQTFVWFIPTELTPRIVRTDPATGKSELVADEGWPVLCTQYCGDGHSRMFSRVYVLTPENYDEKMKELANPFKEKKDGKTAFIPYVTLGEKLYKQIGCASCHSVNGSLGTGPTWKGLWKRDHEFSSVTPNSVGADAAGNYFLKATDPDDKWEAYLTESILDPDAKLVRLGGVNYRGMSSFASQLSGSTTNDEKRPPLSPISRAWARPAGSPTSLPSKTPTSLTPTTPNSSTPRAWASTPSRGTASRPARRSPSPTEQGSLTTDHEP